jgi:hypothetical protein
VGDGELFGEVALGEELAADLGLGLDHEFAVDEVG